MNVHWELLKKNLVEMKWAKGYLVTLDEIAAFQIGQTFTVHDLKTFTTGKAGGTVVALLRHATKCGLLAVVRRKRRGKSVRLVYRKEQ